MFLDLGYVFIHSTISPEGKDVAIFTMKVRITPGNFISLVISPKLNIDVFLLGTAAKKKKKKS